MYKVSLINLTPDAGSVAPLSHRELPGVPPGDLERLLRKFCAIDPVENAVADTEIRVQVRQESYLLRSEHGKLILYDVHRRDIPAQIMTVEAALRELDGSAALDRLQALATARGLEGIGAAPAAPPPASESARPRPRVVASLVAVAALLLAAISWLQPAAPAGDRPAGFVPLSGEEAVQVSSRLVGVYLTGTDPGHHGIAIMGPGQLKLFELAAVEAPRVVYAEYRPGRIGQWLVLITDQPGGTIEVTTGGHLLYDGETYQRIP